MGMALNKVEDPRDSLGKATRDELWDFAKSKGVVPAMLEYLSKYQWQPDRGFFERTQTFKADVNTATKFEMENYLRNRGLFEIRPAVRVMGRDINAPAPDVIVRKETSGHVLDFIERTSSTRAQLAKECKRLGIKMSRTDTKEVLLEKLSGQSHAA